MITPINLRSFKRWALKQLYAELFEFIAKDFMGRTDCSLVHLPSNMVAPTGGGPVEHLIHRGGHSTVINGKKAAYKAQAELGAVQAEAAAEGTPTQFTG